MSPPKAGVPSRRRWFTPAQKIAHLEQYEAACETGQYSAYLRREGLYSSLISEWRRLRDAGLLEGKDPGTRVGRPSAALAAARATTPERFGTDTDPEILDDVPEDAWINQPAAPAEPADQAAA